MSLHWSLRGRCDPSNADWFSRTSHVLDDYNEAALALCEYCPVLAQCRAKLLAYAPGERAMLIGGGLVFDGAGDVIDPPHRELKPDPPAPSPLVQRQCQWCEMWFAGRKWQRYCKVVCRDAYHNSRRSRRPYYDGRRDRYQVGAWT